MKAIFEEYGALIIVVVVALMLIATAGLMFNDSDTGWVQSAFKETGLAEKASSSPTEESHYDLAMRTYTQDEIDKNVYMYSVGATSPEYIVASFNKDYTEVTIFKNGDASDGLCKDYTEEANSIFTQFYAEDLTSAIIETGVTNISSYMFYECVKLSSVTIPESVTSISSAAFSGCTELTTVYGVSGSYAETFAAENGYVFVAM